MTTLDLLDFENIKNNFNGYSYDFHYKNFDSTYRIINFKLYSKITTEIILPNRPIPVNSKSYNRSDFK